MQGEATARGAAPAQSVERSPTDEAHASVEAPERATWLRVHRRLVIGAGATLVVAPLVWMGLTRPLVGDSSTAGVVSRGGPAKGVGPKVDYEAPNIRLKDPSGKPIELKQFRGKAVVLNFWATWCAPCREEMPELEQIYRQYNDQGLVVLAVSIDGESSAKDVGAYLKEGSPRVGSYTFPVMLDTKQEAAQTYKLLGVPSTFFVDPAGVIRSVQPRVMDHRMLMENIKTIFDVPGTAS
ncbi:MAG: TlpA family protein disulfide reductase [Chloroflexi bacterium]|nr:TlpA family protein disulfide reductase [Chloroflexota bacterium]